MANKDDYLTTYREFFEFFEKTLNPNDQLPVKLASYKLLNVEVVGAIIDWTTQYLSYKKCPPHLLSPIIKIIIDEIRNVCKNDPITHGFNSKENAYEPLKLMQTVMAKTYEVCLRYRDNSMLCSLPAPSNNYFPTSVCGMRNRRRKMEDRHVVIHDLNTMFNIQEASPSSYYAIFDGHAGHDAAVYSAAHLHQFLAENKHFVANPEQALMDAFCKTDALFIEKCDVESLTGGTTAVVALLYPKEKILYIAWVGDSQALLVNQGRILQCVNPHKPSRDDERERIEKAGGVVMLWGTWRVNGQLAVSRAIGDGDYKPSVIAIPDVREINLDGGEDFLIIACDGLWDFLSEDAAAQEVYYRVSENPDNTERISQQLANLARDEGSTDNISIIIVFLKDPHQIAAQAQLRASRIRPQFTTAKMEAGLDNANNPFNNSNGLKNLDMDDDNINLQKNTDGLLLNLTDNFKANGTDLSQDIFITEKSNGTKKSEADLNFDDDFGPETDIDAVDDAFSPVDKEKAFVDGLNKDLMVENAQKSFTDEIKAFADGLANNHPLEGKFNPFNDENKETVEEASKETDFDEVETDNGREETPTPRDEAVQDAGGLEENPGESDSEDEWNYIKGDQNKQENITSQPETVVEQSEEDAMSQLNPDAAEFVPVSPTRSIPSPACRNLINDEVISQSPRRPARIDINVPSETEFDKEVKSRPSDFEDYKNGHDSESDMSPVKGEQIDNILNGKSLDEIPEFHPGSTPAKRNFADDFHFGPNAAPFTPKALDQSEALSTNANFGDDTEQTINLNDSEFALQPSKEQSDPMSMSFYAEKGESNPFEANNDEDLNKVHELPENLEAFLHSEDFDEDEKENLIFNETISDLPEHDPLDNDQAAIQTTDLDKLSQDDEKELASPLEEVDFIPNNDLSVTQSAQSNLLDDFIVINKEKPQEDEEKDELSIEEPVCELRPETLSPQPIESPAESVSPIPQVEHELIPTECSFPQPTAPIIVDDLLEAPSTEFEEVTQSGIPDSPLSFETKSPGIDLEEAISPVCEFKPTEQFECQFNPKSEVENIESTEELLDFGISPTPACKFPFESPSCDFMRKDEMAYSESPIDLLQERRQEEEVTSSVKDDVSSPVEPLSPVKSPESFIEDAGKPSETELTFEINQEQIRECPIPDSQPELNLETPAPIEANEVVSNGFDNFSQIHEQIPIKTDSITPEFAEPAVITPSEESRAIDEIHAASPVPSQPELPLEEAPAAPETVESIPEPAHVPEPIVESVPEPIAAPVVEVAAPVIEVPKALEVAEAIVDAPKDIPVAAVAPLAVKEAKVEEKKTPLGKKPIGKVEPRKSLAASPRTAAPKASPKSATKPAVSAKVPAKSGTKPPTAAAPKPAAPTSRTLLKPKTASAPKPPTTNGDVKTAPKPLAKKSVSETTATKSLSRPATASAAPRPKPTPTATSRPATAPRTSAPKPTAPKPSTAAAAAKPRVALSSRPAPGVISKTTTAAKTTTTSSNTKPIPSPKTTAAPAKPRTITSTVPKPRAPLTKTISKSADVEKEKKESANKLTASRTTTVSKTTTTRTATTALKKTEVKSSSERTASAKTAIKHSVAKKPGDLKVTAKTKTTKVESPKQNGVAPTHITEEIKEITVVNNVINGSDSDLLVKDNSPLDNKMLIETSNNLIDTNPAD